MKRLVGVVERLRAEGARAAEENARLTRELDATRLRLAEAEEVQTEVTALRDERNVIRTRVNEMLQQIEALNL